MISIDFPSHTLKIKQEQGKEYIFDTVRKKWLRLTPEEWVRQNFLQYLLQEKKYPASLIAIEKEIKLGELKKRCDLVIYQSQKPWMVIECKEPGTSLKDIVWEQVLAYNITLQVAYIIITNGNDTLGFEINAGQVKAVRAIPEWI